MHNCKTCYWDYNGTCTHENLDDIYNDNTYGKENCVGWLRTDHEEHFYSTYEQVLGLLRKRNCDEMENILEFIKSQRSEVNGKVDL